MANMPASVHTLRISAPGNEFRFHFQENAGYIFLMAQMGPVNVQQISFGFGQEQRKKAGTVWLTGAVGTQTSQQLEANIPLHTHRASMDLKDVCATL